MMVLIGKFERGPICKNMTVWHGCPTFSETLDVNETIGGFTADDIKPKIDDQILSEQLLEAFKAYFQLPKLKEITDTISLKYEIESSILKFFDNKNDFEGDNFYELVDHLKETIDKLVM